MTRKRGRPPIDPTDRSVKFTITLPGAHYAALNAEARRDRVSVSDLARRRLAPVFPARSDFRPPK